LSIIAGEHYAAVVAQRLVAESQTLSARWLERLRELLTVDANDVFPSAALLDHIPALIGEIAGYLRAPADEEIAANTAVIAKACELGTLRHQQRASVHQLLREYEMLADILETFVIEETARLGLRPKPEECFGILRRLSRAAGTLMRTTVDTFVAAYTATIEERNERIRQFNQMASHEMRSPIGTLLFAAAALRIDSVRADAGRMEKVVSTIQSNAERLSWLVQNLQRLARLTEPDDAPNEQRVDIETVAIEVARQLAEMAANRNVAIRIVGPLPVLVGDPARLELILLNLVSNAIKYSDAGKPESFVEIASPPVTGNPHTCTIVVRDNGLGIGESEVAAIFDRFFRAHAHLDGDLGVSGAGLGLAIVAECVEALHGSIRCESKPAQGTSFFLTLPCEAGSRLDA
jgi:signal transduction histidine kinase